MRTSACSSSKRNSASARASLGLADPGRPQEEETAERPVRVLEPGPGAPNRVGHRLDRFVLADDPLVQTVLHVQQLLDFAFHAAG